MRQDKKAKRTLNISWWKLIVGAILISAGIVFGIFYFKNIQNVAMGILTALTIAPGIFLVYMGWKAGESGFAFSTGQKKYTGKENAIVLTARLDTNTKKDVPVNISFIAVDEPPEGARLHYVRNLKKHFYELFNDTKTNELKPVFLPDKKASPPELFKIPATMQPYKDCMDYNPPTLLQKIAPGILLGAMVIVGILMVMTGG